MKMAPKKILIVDDTREDLYLLETLLSRNQYEVATASNGVEALEKVSRDGFEVVISDILMSEMDGFQLCRRIKTDPEMKKVLFIFYTASYTDSKDEELGRSLGAERFLIKPLEPAVFLKTLKEAIQDHRSGRLEEARPPVAEERVYLKQYNERLVQKLKDKLMELEQARGMLQESRNFLRTVIQSEPECVKLLSAQGNLIDMNPAGVAMIEADSLEQFIGKSIYPLIAPVHREAFKSLVEKVFQGLAGTLEYEIIGCKGTHRWLESYAVPLRNPKNEIVAFLSVTRDISRQKAQAAALEYQAHYDPLTGLPNRTLLYNRMMENFLTAGDEKRSPALLIINIGRFQEINDTLGHPSGDLLLQRVGSRLRELVELDGFVARMGGDEYAVFLPSGGIQRAVRMGEGITREMESPFEIGGLPIAVEGHVGIALHPDHGTVPELLMRHAAVAMHAAKESGGSVVYDPAHDRHTPRRLVLLAELRQAIEREELILYGQPKISFKTGTVIGVEALVRWKHPLHGMIEPMEFILPAEKTGLIQWLTLWVFNAAQRQYLLWQEAGIEIPISVNLSIRNLHDPKFPDLLLKRVQESGVRPDRLELEITESMIMQDPEQALEATTSMRKAGFHFAIDDFGTGYSSLAYLQKLPVDTIKIDKSFVIHMSTNPNDAMIVRSTVDLAHNLGLEVVAEGVETRESWDRLTAIGCDTAQGYYLCSPMPVNELTRWMTESSWGLKGAA